MKIKNIFLVSSLLILILLIGQFFACGTADVEEERDDQSYTKEQKKDRREKYFSKAANYWAGVDTHIRFTDEKLLENFYALMDHEHNRPYSNVLYHIFRVHADKIIKKNEDRKYFWDNHDSEMIDSLHQDIIAKARETGIHESNGFFHLDDCVSYQVEDTRVMRDMANHFGWSEFHKRYQEHYNGIVGEKYAKKNNVNYSYGVVPGSSHASNIGGDCHDYSGGCYGDIWINDIYNSGYPAYVIPYEFDQNVSEEAQERFREHMDEWEDAVNLNPDRLANKLIFIRADDTSSVYVYTDHRYIRFRFDASIGGGGKVTHLGLPLTDSNNGNLRISEVLMGFPNDFGQTYLGVTGVLYNGVGLETTTPHINITNINYRTEYCLTVELGSSGVMMGGDGSIKPINVITNCVYDDFDLYLDVISVFENSESANVTAYHTSTGTYSYETVRQIDSRFNQVSRHEIGHILGLWHEHQRPDKSEWINFWHSPISFDVYSSSLDATFTNQYFTKYDLKSIMHYNTFQGVRLNCDSPNNQCWDEIIYYHDGISFVDINNGLFPNHFLSFKDIQGVKKLYPANTPQWNWSGGGWK